MEREKGTERETKGEWVTVTNKRRNAQKFTGKHLEIPSHGPSTTIFFTNFHHNWTQNIMWEIFAKYGDIVDVFIASRNSKAGMPFGFARFLNVSNVSDFEPLLNSIHIGTRKLRCNVARFQRQKPISFRDPDKNQSKTAPNPPPLAGKTKSHPTTTHSRNLKSTPTHRSYLEVATNKSDQTKLVIPVISINSKDNPLAPSPELALVGELKNVFTASNLSSLIQNEGFLDVSIHYLGGLHFLLLFMDNKSVSKFLDCSLSRDCFSLLEPWREEFYPNKRITWIRIEGVPPGAWLSDTFSKIGEVWGTIIIPELCEPHKTNRSVGKLCILTSYVHFINTIMDVEVDGSLCEIRIIEESKEVDLLFGFSDESDSSFPGSVGNCHRNWVRRLLRIPRKMIHFW